MQHRSPTIGGTALSRPALALLLGWLLLPLGSCAMEVKPCAKASELECLQSTECTLVQSEEKGGYSCQASVDRCDIGFRQSADYDIQKDCEARPGCVFQPARCYCPPEVNCVCGGGPPAQCIDRKSAP